MEEYRKLAEQNMDQNDIVELASIGGTESVMTGLLSRANTDLLPQ